MTKQENMDEVKNDLLKETKRIDKIGKPMGIGIIGGPDVVFVRQFRWTFATGKNIEYFVKNVSFDHLNRVINVSIMEVALSGSEELDLHAWLESDLEKEKIVFTTYDGCGQSIYEYEFKNLTLLSDCSAFDYASSEVSIRNISLKYEEFSRKYFPFSVKKPEVKKARPHWELSTKSNDKKYKVKIQSRPNCDIKETELNFLGNKTWIPGKATWENTVISLDKQHDMEFLSDLIKGNSPDIILTMTNGHETLESWTLINCQLVNLKTIPSEKEGDPDNKYEITVGCRYVELKVAKNG
jgi:hypothetical protein